MRVRHLLDRLRTPSAAFAHDLAMIPIAWLGAFWLRFNLEPLPSEYLGQAIATLPAMVVVQGAVFWYFGLYRGVWRFASLPDLVRIMRAILVGASIGAVFVFFQTRMQFVPRSAFPLFAVLLVLLLGGPRLLYRWSKDHQFYRHLARKVLIVGAGAAGETLARDLLRDRSYGYYPVGFVDDDPGKKGREIRGLRVLGYCKRIPEHVRATGAELVIIAVPSATSAQMRRIVEQCEHAGVPMRTLPRMQDLVSGRATVSELRRISIEDLLGREPVSLDWGSIEGGIRDRRVLVTGGGGSIGSELCRQVARLGPRELVVLDNGEFNLYTVERELRAAFPALALHVVLADVCDAAADEHACARFRPHVVFHAAAYKHVPMLEHQAREAVRVNVLGTERIARAAAAHGAETFVLISTDKAVNPANAMGASKRGAELAGQLVARRHPGTRFITVRFGNVLDSAGSVVPLFRRQIEEGGPVTVTHPEVERYFMTIPEACQLILEAGAIGRGGEVFVLDMGEPIRIAYLAEQMILLAGKRPGEDVCIEYVGLRPGEKMFEELFNEGESLAQTGHAKILLARARELDAPVLARRLEALAAACEAFDEARLEAALRELVPELGARTAPAAVVIPIEQGKR